MKAHSYAQLVKLISNIHFIIMTEARKFNKSDILFQLQDHAVSYSRLNRQTEAITIGALCIEVFKPLQHFTKLKVSYLGTEVFGGTITISYTSDIKVDTFSAGVWITKLSTINFNLRNHKLTRIIPVI